MRFKTPEEKERFTRILAPLLRHPKVQEMKGFVQHGQVSTYDHCLQVAWLCFRWNIDKNLGADEETLLRSAMLHDFYLYDWHHKDGGSHDLHGFIHAKRAMDNAICYFDISPKEQSIIYSHMWPLNLNRVPASKEAWIVCLADKYASLAETLFLRDRAAR